MIPSEYEARSAQHLKRSFALAFHRGRDALVAAVNCAGIGPSDPIALSPLTCQVVPLALMAAKHELRYVDIDRPTLNLSAGAVRSALHEGVRAVLFQETYGQAAGLKDVAEVCEEHELPLIVDAAQSFPASFDGHEPGVYGNAAIFSNAATKPMPAGSGGLLVTQDQALGMRAQCLRDRLPFPSRVSTLRASLGLWLFERVVTPKRYWPLLMLKERLRRPLDKVDMKALLDRTRRAASRVSRTEEARGLRALETLEKRVGHCFQCCADYRERLQGAASLELPIPDSRSPLLYFPVLLKDKAGFLERARRRKLEVVPWPWHTPIYPLRSALELERLGYEAGQCPEAEAVANQLVGFPTHLGVNERHRLALCEEALR